MMDNIDPIIQKELWDELPPMEQITTESGRWYSPSDAPNDKYYSVTTVIDASKSISAKKAIDDWKRREIAAGKDPGRFSRDGDLMHQLIEFCIKNNGEYPTEEDIGEINKVLKDSAEIIDTKKLLKVYLESGYASPEIEDSLPRAYKLFKKYDEEFLKKVHVVPHVIEGRVFTEVDGMKYAGTIDLVATVQHEPEGKKELAIIDHKSISNIKNASSKRKGYLPQLAAYAKAIKDKYGKTIEVAYLNFASEKSFKSYRIELSEILEQWDQFYYKLDSFYRKGILPSE